MVKKTPPPLDGLLVYIAIGDGEVARDANGRHVDLDRERWLDAEGIREPGTRDAYCRLWEAMQAERDLVQSERLDATLEGDDED